MLTEGAIEQSGGGVSLIFKDFSAEFLKRAEGDVHFISQDGAAVRDLVRRAIDSIAAMSVTDVRRWIEGLQRTDAGADDADVGRYVLAERRVVLVAEHAVGGGGLLAAVQRVMALKEREETKPFIVLAGSVDQLADLGIVASDDLISIEVANNDAAAVLKWAVMEMEDRYRLLSVNKCRNIQEFNQRVQTGVPVHLPPRPDVAFELLRCVRQDGVRGG